MDTQELRLGGERRVAQDGACFDVINPSTGHVCARVSQAGPADVNLAVGMADEAVRGAWRRTLPVERGRLLQRIAASIRGESGSLALIESEDTGKPLREARTDVEVAARYFEFYGGVADKIMGETIPLGPEYIDFTLREPIGVSAQVVPWNYPLQLGCRGIAPALAAGCSVVVKPSVLAPLSLLRLADICYAEGLPTGTMSVIPGPGSQTGSWLAGHRGINQLTFTGSVSGATAITRLAGANLVPTVIEAGGKSPIVAAADADVDQVADIVTRAMFQNAGQTCSAPSRLLAAAPIHDDLVNAIVERASRLRIGPASVDPDMGPVISSDHRTVVEEAVTRAVDEGANVASGGGRPHEDGIGNGYFLRPTVLTDLTREMEVAQHEVFGPVLSVFSWTRTDDLVDLANGTDYGLVAGIFTRDIGLAMDLATRIVAGQVFVNGYGAGGGVELPFGGNKRSGYGREKGLEALRSYTQVKNVCIRL